MARKPPGSVFKRCGCRRGRAGLRLGASCPRLAEEEHGSWFFSLELPRHVGGTRRRIRRGGYASREEAERALRRLQVTGGRVLTVADWLEFTALDGGPLSPDYLTATFAQLVKASGLPPVRLHDLRHGAASLALAAGVDLKVVADQLGHCSIVLT